MLMDAVVYACAHGFMPKRHGGCLGHAAKQDMQGDRALLQSISAASWPNKQTGIKDTKTRVLDATVAASVSTNRPLPECPHIRQSFSPPSHQQQPRHAHTHARLTLSHDAVWREREHRGVFCSSSPREECCSYSPREDSCSDPPTEECCSNGPYPHTTSDNAVCHRWSK